MPVDLNCNSSQIAKDVVDDQKIKMSKGCAKTRGVANIIEDGKLGGPQVRIMRVAQTLGSDVETTVVMPSENSKTFQARCSAANISYKTFWMSRITKQWDVALRYVVFFPWEVLRLAVYFRRGGFDLVHASGGSWQFKGVIAARLAGKKALWHLNDTYMPGFLRRTFRILSPLASGYIFASERSREYYGSLLDQGKPGFVIPAPVDTAQFDPSIAVSGDKELIAQWQGKPVVGMMANVSPIKGVDVFVRVAAQLNARFDDLVFVVIGPVYKNQQRYHERIKSLCDECGVHNIAFVGGRSDVRPLLKRVDVYLCTSLAESSPMAVWEAMSMAKPVVSTDVGDVPLYVKPGRNGFVDPVGDVQALAGHVAELVDNADLREQLGTESRKVAVQELDVSRCAQRHLEAYRYLVESKRAPTSR